MIERPNIFKRRAADDDLAQYEWLVTYSDMVTLLLAFFVLLASISKVDLVLFEKVQSGMARDIGRRDVLQPIEMLKQDVLDTIVALKAEDIVSVGTDEDGITLDIPSTALFAPGSAVLIPQSRDALRRIMETIAVPAYDAFQIEVQGHTDNLPINTPEFPSNWELSSARATAALRVLLETGTASSRLRAVGMADAAPKVPNTDAQGNALPTNQEINRRVVIRIYPR